MILSCSIRRLSLRSLKIYTLFICYTLTTYLLDLNVINLKKVLTWNFFYFESIRIYDLILYLVRI